MRKARYSNVKELDALIDRIEGELLLAVANRALQEHSVKEAARRAHSMMSTRKWGHDWRRKNRIYEEIEDALKTASLKS